MKCSNCNRETEKIFTSSDNKPICEVCLENEIYAERRKIYKKYYRRLSIVNYIIRICILLTLFILLMEFLWLR